MAVKISGGKVSSIKDLKRSLKKGGQGGRITRVKADEELTVRFITDPDEWVQYYEHYDSIKGYFPCIQQDCPGCADRSKDNRRSQRYMACAVDISEGKVVALSMPKTLASSLIKFYEKYDTLMDRDYELSREGEGFDTEYSAIPEGPTKMSLSKYEPLDLEALLESLVSGDDDEDDEDEEEEKPATRRPGIKKTAPSVKRRVIKRR